jgi:glycosyltransferase involved in cell wall biosynthesis
MTKLRVLIVSTRFPDPLRPELGNFIARQARALAARPEVEVRVVAPIPRPPWPLSLLPRPRRMRAVAEEEMAEGGLRVHRPRFLVVRGVPALRPFFLARRLVKLARRIRADFPFDLILADFAWPEGPASVVARRRLGVPVAVKVRGMDLDGRLHGRATGRQALAALRAADGLLAVSGAVKAQMAALGLPADSILVHRTGLDHRLFRLCDKAVAKAALGHEGPLLLAVGNLIRRKRHDLILEATARVAGARLIIAGDGPERRRLVRKARDLGIEDRVRMAGSVPQALMPGLYAAADVTVHAARAEGLANVWVESLACGTPVVTTAAGGATEVIDRPAAGRVVAADAGAIAGAVRALLADPPEPSKVAAAASSFSWESNAAALEAELRALVARQET